MEWLRLKLTEKEKYQYLSIEKGYEGELKFDTFKLKHYLYWGVITFTDIKNNEGDYYAEKTGREYKNPHFPAKAQRNSIPPTAPKPLAKLHCRSILYQAPTDLPIIL
ncbi:hypothetical protein [Ammoniphilus sp. YIM 78166]|uniref:hypothetical protein n=1 Tax=Ammoniphilus sp. YIM 78166 TaxID=1644106 RepID=UPI001F0FFD7B|nr:hypothetical protein [Ammoniphilus sp. YIM 78166]